MTVAWLAGVLILTAFSQQPAAATAPEAAPAFAHLAVEGRAITLANRLALRVEADASLKAIGPSHRVDSFNDRPYEISLAGFVGEDGAVLVHGERVADASGASNYDDLPAARWPDADFRRRSMCADVSPADVAGEHDLAWLRAGGFEPSGSVAIEQVLLTTADHNDEAVISLVVKGVDCADEAAVAAAHERLRGKITVTRP